MPHRPARHPWVRTGVLAALLVVLGTLGLIGIDRAGAVVATGDEPAGSSAQVERPIGHVAFGSPTGKRPVAGCDRAPGGDDRHPVATAARAGAGAPAGVRGVVSRGADVPALRVVWPDGWCGRAPPVAAV